LPALTKLNSRDCKSISGLGFACLSSLTSLQELNVRFTVINHEVFAGLRSPAAARQQHGMGRSRLPIQLTVSFAQFISYYGHA